MDLRAPTPTTSRGASCRVRRVRGARSGGAAGEKQAHLLFSLLLWDLRAAHGREGRARDEAPRGRGYLVAAPGSRAARAMVKVAQGRKLGALLRPVRLLSEAHPHAAVVLACQEMPPTRGDIPCRSA